MKKIIFIVAIFTLLLTACGSSVSAESPNKVVEAYLAALTAGDSTQAVNLSCAAWESSAIDDSAAFEGVEVRLANANCGIENQDGSNAVVSCTGQFVFNYAGGETQSIGLEFKKYVLVFENDAWRMCGYQ